MGFLIPVVGWPLNAVLIKRRKPVQEAVSIAADNRMAKIGEFIPAMPIAKLQGLDKWLTGGVLKAREVELKCMSQGILQSPSFGANVF